MSPSLFLLHLLQLATSLNNVLAHRVVLLQRPGTLSLLELETNALLVIDMVKLFVLCLQFGYLTYQSPNVALLLLSPLLIALGSVSDHGVLKTIGAIVRVSFFPDFAVSYGDNLLSGEFPMLAEGGGVDDGEGAVRLLGRYFLPEAGVPFLYFYEALEGLYVGKFLCEYFYFEAFFALPLAGSDLLELVCCLVGESLLLGPEEGLEEALLVRNDPALVIDLFLIVRQSLPTHSFLLLLDLACDQKAHVQLGAFVDEFLQREEEGVQVSELSRQ